MIRKLYILIFLLCLFPTIAFSKNNLSNIQLLCPTLLWGFEFISSNKVKVIKTDLNKITPWMSDIIIQNKTKKNKLIKFLDKKNIETRIFYPPIHKLKPYFTNNKKFPVSSEISNKGLWLPSSTTLTDKEINFICKEIKNFFQ